MARSLFALLIVLLAIAVAGCCSPAPEHVVVPGPGGQARILHVEPGWIAKEHGCDGHSHLNLDYLPNPAGK
jgi:hypothetical protein